MIHHTVDTPPTLTSERLLLRPLSLDDVPALHPIYRDPETMRFMPTLPHESPAETRAELELDMARDGALLWTVCQRSNGRPIGIVHYLGETRVPGMGYIINRQWWWQGFATEACRAALSYGFNDLQLDRVELWINEHNMASQRVGQKLGFAIKGRILQKYTHERHNHIMLIYGLWAHEWRGRGAPAAERIRFFGVEPVLFVADVARSVRFYRQKLGFDVDFVYGDPPDHAGIVRGDWTGSSAAVQLSRRRGDDASAAPSAYLYFKVGGDIDQLCEVFRANGVTISAEPQTYPWGMREFSVNDLDGHRLRFGGNA